MLARRVLLVDPDAASRAALADRLRRLGYEVSEAADGAEGAVAAMGAPPHAVVADLWMPSISGVQLCRLLNNEPATASVPVLLRGPDDQRNRFWAERAGAVAYVVKGSMGSLVRNLSRSIAASADADGFFTALSDDAHEIRDRIAAHLDQALFDSVIAADVRQLATCESFERLFDLFAQFVSQVTRYRWLAVSTHMPSRVALHSRPSLRAQAIEESHACLGMLSGTPTLHVEDDDAADARSGPEPIIRPIRFGEITLGQLAIAPCRVSADDEQLATVLAHELGGALRTALLVEETQRLAAIDALTGLRNRRAFLDMTGRELLHCMRFGEPLSLLMVDIDHFKQINDKRGHASGDAALAAVGNCLLEGLRAVDLPARWGGEEFIVVLPRTASGGAVVVAERLRSAIEQLQVRDTTGDTFGLTASIGVATYRAREQLDQLIDRADRALYSAKHAGRNRLAVAEDPASVEPPAVLASVA